MPKISVIVPVYKVREYLKRCIDSILIQTFESFDVVLIDDGSPDDCGKICDEYAKKDRRISVIHQRNQGLSEARNVGIEWVLKNSDSEWITFIDSDDWLHRDYLKILYESAIKYNVNLSICNCIKTSKLDEDIEITEEKIKLFKAEEFWCFRQYGIACGKLYKKELLKNIRFPRGLLFEDNFVIYRIIFGQSEVVYIENPLYFYYIREDSITKSKWTPRNLSQLDGWKQQMIFFKSNGYDSAYKITVRNYLREIKNHIDAVKPMKKEYMKDYIQLHFLYRFNLIKLSRYLPIRYYTNMYRFAFPLFTFIYKKYTYLKKCNGHLK